MSPILSREMILQAQDLTTETVAVPEWGGDVLVRAMTGSERDQYEKSILVQKGKDTTVNMTNARAKLVVLTAVDADGNKLFTPADVTALGKKSAAALERVFNAATRLSGISDEDLKELTEEIEANPFDGLPSD